MTGSLSTWADGHRAEALDVVRGYLGVGLLIRGGVFLSDPSAYLDLLPTAAGEAFGSFAVLHYVGLAHVCGGLLLAVGLLTRLAALVQIPILAAAALLVHLPAGVADQSFAFAALVLALLVMFAVWGGGPWSLDRAIAARTDRDEAGEEDRAAEGRRLRVRERAPAPPRPAVAAAGGCGCGHDRRHPRVEAVRDYGAFGALRFVTGTHPLPASVTFRCHDCGGVVETVRPPDDMEAFRYERTRPSAERSDP